MKKAKRVLFDLISPDETILSGNPYEVMAEIRAEHHFEIAAAKIALAWKKGIKPDADARLTLGYCTKATDLQRELIDFDFVIVLNKEVWEDPEFSQAQKKALIDHELCHAARSRDEDGNLRTDSKGRPVWRLRGHDIEEFREIIDRHGCYKRDLEMFAKTILAKQKEPLLTGNGAAL